MVLLKELFHPTLFSAAPKVCMHERVWLNDGHWGDDELMTFKSAEGTYLASRFADGGGGGEERARGREDDGDERLQLHLNQCQSGARERKGLRSGAVRRSSNSPRGPLEAWLLPRVRLTRRDKPCSAVRLHRLG